MNLKLLPATELQSIRQRCEAATPGPWGVINAGSGRMDLYLTSEGEKEVVRLAKYYGPNRVADASAAHANRDVRRLLAEVRRSAPCSTHITADDDVTRLAFPLHSCAHFGSREPAVRILTKSATPAAQPSSRRSLLPLHLLISGAPLRGEFHALAG